MCINFIAFDRDYLLQSLFGGFTLILIGRRQGENRVQVGMTQLEHAPAGVAVAAISTFQRVRPCAVEHSTQLKSHRQPSGPFLPGEQVGMCQPATADYSRQPLLDGCLTDDKGNDFYADLL